MSDQADSKQAAPFAEDPARAAATFLLMDAIEDVPLITPHREVGVSEAILIAAHTITAKLDSMETNQLAALGDLRDSVDCAAGGMAADGDEISDMRKLIAYLAKMEAAQPEVMCALRKHRGEAPPPTEHESELMYRALEADYLANNTPASIEKLDAALCRFKTLAGY